MAKIRTMLKSIKIKIIKTFDPNLRRKISEDERYAMVIARKMISDKNCDLLANPYNGKMYARSDEKGVLLVLSSNPEEVTIINHVYCYNVKLKGRSYNSISEEMEMEIDRRREKMESEYRKNIQHSLKSIANRISND